MPLESLLIFFDFGRNKRVVCRELSHDPLKKAIFRCVIALLLSDLER